MSLRLQILAKDFAHLSTHGGGLGRRACVELCNGAQGHGVEHHVELHNREKVQPRRERGAYEDPLEGELVNTLVEVGLDVPYPFVRRRNRAI